MTTPLNELKLRLSGYYDQLETEYNNTPSDDQRTGIFGAKVAVFVIRRWVDELLDTSYTKVEVGNNTITKNRGK